MIPRKKVIVHDVYTQMEIELESINDANRWFYKNNISKSQMGALSGIQKSLKDRRIIYKHYYVTYKDKMIE